jgi:hypothetical protein
MNVLDFLLLLTLCLGLVLGWKLRAIPLLFLVLAVAAGILAAHHYQAEFAGAFLRFSPRFGGLLAWLTPFVIAFVLCLLAGGLISSAIQLVQLHWLDHLAGAALAGGLALALSAGAVHLLQPVEKAAHLHFIAQSKLAGPLEVWVRPYLEKTPQLWPALGKIFAPTPGP